MISTIVVVGGGQSGSQACDTLRSKGFTGRLILISADHLLPYQRPPLSKKFLAGELPTEKLFFRHQVFYDEHRIELRLGVRVNTLDCANRIIGLSNGETINYDRCLLCVGAVARKLTCPGAGAVHVNYLRNVEDVYSLKTALRPGARVVIVGAGYIGLETAATIRKMGNSVVVLEMADRVMNRVVASNVSQYFENEHRSHGVKIICNARVVRIESTATGSRVMCADGSSFEADALLAGIGAIANDSLAQAAGLKCDNGIVVDEHCRTSDPNVYAAGDCTNHPSLHFEMRVRLESVDNAFEQAKAAAQNMLGQVAPHDRVPWFWSDQFDNKLLIVGLSQNHDQQITRGDPAARTFSVCYLKGGVLLALEAVNKTKDYMAARKLIAERAVPNLDRLADPACLLKDVM